MTKIATILTAIVLMLSAAALAQETPDEAESENLSVEQIVDRSNYASYYQGKDGRAKVKMTIVDEGGDKQSRQMQILRRDHQDEDAQKDQAQDEEADRQMLGEQKFYVYFESPSSFDKMVFLVHKHLETEDDRWMYMPALDNVKRIAGKDKRTSFVGSHYLYEDVSGRNTQADKHELIGQDENYYVLKSTPKDPQAVDFAYYKTWIMKSNFLVRQTVYYDAEDKPYRKYMVLKWDHVGERKYPTVLASRMQDTKMGGYTTLEYSDVEYNIDLPESIFTERYLRRAPRSYLK
jgi:outer membrane lipoprotein-sorting protein